MGEHTGLRGEIKSIVVGKRSWKWLKRGEGELKSEKVIH